MNEFDSIYRAFISYRKETVGQQDCAAQRSALSKANAEQDKITVTRYILTVENDWIDAIEEGLTHVEKAIAEERQFIRSNGEVLPIEKIKRVSRDSVEHLARHSDLITKEHEEGELVPDRLYTVERLSDYAVYENRFLYMLLSYLLAFISLRYDKIVELSHTYSGKLYLNKVVSGRNRRFTLDVALTDERKNDPFLKEYCDVKEKIERIDLCMKSVMHYLKTPLMEEVAKVPVLKPPVTKTNVLKMNKNFKGALKLYEFVSSYSADGYTVEEVTQTHSPFSESVADEVAEAGELLSFLTYEHGLGLENAFRESFEEEEERRKEAEEKKMLARLKSLKKRIAESGQGQEEYMLLLEKRNRTLEDVNIRFNAVQSENETLKCEVENLTKTADELKDAIVKKDAEKLAADEAHAQEIIRLCSEHKEELLQRERQEQEKLSLLQAECDERIAFERELRERQSEEYGRKISEAEGALSREREERAEEVARINGEYEEKLRASDEKHGEEISRLRADCAQLAEERDSLREQKMLSDGKLNALRGERGEVDADEFLEKDDFDELERQYLALQKLFKEKWKSAKKKIRRDTLRSEKNKKD